MHYKNQSVLLASMHEKERAIAPPFLQRLSCTLAVHSFDSDQFGTFTGEIERTLSPYDTCLLKARKAAEQYDYRLAVASEGSFGTHRLAPCLPSAYEVMLFIDREQDWIVAEHLSSQKTNYAMKIVNKETDISAFIEHVGFPDHALIVQSTTDKHVFAKGIQDMESLSRCLNLGYKREKELLLATDMRAMMNPTRMAALGVLADKLALRIATLCIQCGIPGFGFKSTRGALPCALCAMPTSFYQEEIWGCIRCEYQEYKMRTDGMVTVDPGYCDYCNP